MSQNLISTSAPVSPDAIWQATLGELQLQLTKPTFDTWLKPTYPVSYEDGTFIIATPTVYVKDWLENRMMSQVKRALSRVMGRSVEIKFTVCPTQTPPPEPMGLLLDMPIPTNTELPRSKLQKQYTFDTFVVGESNQLAHAAARAVADLPAIRYNPLFVYGGVGLGKTHLMHAIGHATLNQGREVLYVSSEEFTNDLIRSIRDHNTADFRYKYRAVDLLLVDDIQFIAGKESTQEEFFHTFNTLHSTGKQIVLTSDRPPKAITTLERRLCSRFEGGLIVDIQPPNLETRMAILRAKADEHGWHVDFDVLHLIAQKFHSNIRELEGGFNRVVAYTELMGWPLNLETALMALSSMTIQPQPPALNTILETVASYYKLQVSDLTGRARKQQVALPRHVAMYLMREDAKASLPQIGEILGGRDHTTVLHGCEKMASQIEEDDSLRRDVNAIREQLYETARRH